MQNFKDRYGKWATVAGAAEGLGAAFSTILAKWGMNIIMIDHEEEKLKDTERKLKETYNIQTEGICLDLSKIGNIDIILGKMTNVGCRLLIYNAAYGPVKRFTDNSVEELDYYIDLNSRMPMHMVYRLIKMVPQDQRTGILIMSSLAGLWGTQLVVPYGATKAFDYNLAEGLYYELKDKRIDVMACCAGATDTPNYRNTKPKKNFFGPAIMSPFSIAEKALKYLGKKPLYIPGFMNRLTYFLLNRIFSRSFSSGLMNRTMGKMYID